MTTELERIAVKARCEQELRFTSLAHHVTRDRVERNLKKNSQLLGAGGSREGSVTWEIFHEIKERFPLQRPRLRLNYVEFQSFAVL